MLKYYVKIRKYIIKLKFRAKHKIEDHSSLSSIIITIPVPT